MIAERGAHWDLISEMNDFATAVVLVESMPTSTVGALRIECNRRMQWSRWNNRMVHCSSTALRDFGRKSRLMESNARWRAWSPSSASTYCSRGPLWGSFRNSPSFSNIATFNRPEMSNSSRFPSEEWSAFRTPERIPNAGPK
jgi:hypothetical protein